MPIIILGGIFGGIFTPTEASAVAVVYSLIISLFVYKDMSFKELPQVFVEGAVSTATIMVMVGLSSASSYVITTSGLPQQLVSFFSSITNSPVVILLLLNILFLIIGMLMEANAAVVMMTPILLPLLNAFGIDLLQFGIVMSFNLCIGLVTPPVGLCLLLCNQTGETRLSHSLKAMMPMLLISIIVLFLITYVSPLTTLLPASWRADCEERKSWICKKSDFWEWASWDCLWRKTWCRSAGCPCWATMWSSSRWTPSGRQAASPSVTRQKSTRPAT